MKAFLRLVPFILSVAILWGCSLVRHPPSRPSIQAPQLLERMRASNEGMRSVRGVARIELVYQGEKVRTRQAIALAKPGMMRLETLSFLNQPLLILATDGVTLQAISLSENRFYRGTVSTGLNQLTRLGMMSSEDLVSLILGEIPPDGDGALRYDSRRNLYELTFPPSMRWETQTFWIHPETLKVVEASKTDIFTREETRVSYNKFRKTDSVIFPTEIEIEAPGENSRIGLSFRKIEINPPLSLDLFRLSIPPGVEVVEMEDPTGLFPPALSE